MRVSDLKQGDVATVTGFAVEVPHLTSSRFRALGFVIGAVLVVERRLPWGGPMVVSLGGSAFALEPDAAAFVNVSEGSHR